MHDRCEQEKNLASLNQSRANRLPVAYHGRFRIASRMLDAPGGLFLPMFASFIIKFYILSFTVAHL